MPAPQTTVRKIVEKLKLRLAAISVANGYQTELGANGGKPFDRWPRQYQEDELAAAPRLGIFDLVQTRTQSFPREKQVPATSPFQIRGFVKNTESPDVMDLMIADVLQAIIMDPATGKEDPTFGGLAVDTKPTEVGFIVPADTFEITGFAIGFEVELLVRPFSAYE